MICIHENHDHTTDPDDGTRRLVPMRCNDCGVPTHWDEGIHDYVHDDADADPCFLIPSRPDGASPCIGKARFVKAGVARVGQRRVAGGTITDIRTSKSGKTVFITDDRNGTETFTPVMGIAIYDEEGQS